MEKPASAEGKPPTTASSTGGVQENVDAKTEEQQKGGGDKKIATVLQDGKPDSYRSRGRIKDYLKDFKDALGLPPANHPLDSAMEEFLTEVLLGAAWYQHHYKGARRTVWAYIGVNCILVLAVPLIIMALPVILAKFAANHNVSISVTSQTTAQITTLLTAVLALQKTLAAWYSSQQRYAAWYKSASDLKTIYYQFVQSWFGKTQADQLGFRAALAAGASAGRKVISDEQYDYYQKLALPSFDILDLLTSTRSAAAGLVTSLLPNSTTTVGAFGKNALATSANAPSGSPILAPATTSATNYPVPGGPRAPSKILRIAAGQGVDILPTTALRTALDPGPPDGANWITCAYTDCQKQITVFETTWMVPDAPIATANQLIYLFNGVQPSNQSYILQPVLQWGNYGDTAEDGDGPFWTVASWLVTQGSAVHTNHVRVFPGATVTGRISFVASSPNYPGTFVYKCEFVGIVGTQWQTPPIPAPTYCVNALEAYEHRDGLTVPYDLDAQSEYPASSSVLFSSNKIFTDNPDIPVTPQWQTQQWRPAFGEKTTPVDAYGNNISFGTATSPSA